MSNVRKSMVAAVCGMALWMGTAYSETGTPKAAMQQYKEMFDASQQQKKGLQFFVQGQSIGGLVLKVTDETVEVRNQQYGRIVIRLDRIDAVAMP